jgi:hypothetical protein
MTSKMTRPLGGLFPQKIIQRLRPSPNRFNNRSNYPSPTKREGREPPFDAAFGFGAKKTAF